MKTGVKIMKEKENHYETLQVPQNASAKEIKKAYHKLLRTP